MIAFVSLFLGLVTGVQPVEWTVTESAAGNAIASVELRLDGRALGTLRGEPWVLDCDFGRELAPHRLTAVGFDADGREVARAEQWINLPRRRSEAELVLESPPDGRAARHARLLWQSVDGLQPTEVIVTFDGEPVPVEDPRRIDLPDHDPATLHLLQAEIVLGGGSFTVERTVGGWGGDEVESELTAFPVLLAPGTRLPEASEMEGWLTRGGRPLRVVAVDSARADVWMVQDQSDLVQGRLRKLGADEVEHRRSSRRRPPSGLKPGDRFRLLFPASQRAAEATLPAELFPVSRDLAAPRRGPSSMGVGQRRVAEPSPEGLYAAIPFREGVRLEAADQRLTDAVAVAGLASAFGRRARAVVLVLGESTNDRSVYSPEQVRAYLHRLQVPLRVWSTASRTGETSWGEMIEVSNQPKLLRAIRDLRTLLDRQVVVWLEGRHLPQEIELSAAAAGTLRPVTEGYGIPEDAGIPQNFVAELPPSGEPGLPDEPGLPALPEEPREPEAPGDPALSGIEASLAETVEVRVVNLDVVVSGRDGRPVRDLSREDFELFEDGRPMEITHFQEPRPAARTSPGSPEPQAPAGDPGASAAEAVRPLQLVIFVDAAHLQVRDRRRMLRALRETLPGTRPVTLVVYESGGRMRRLLTRTPEELDRALTEIGRTASPPNRRQSLSMLAEMVDVKEDLVSARSAPPEIRGATVGSAQAHRESILSMLRAESEIRHKEVLDVLATLTRLAAGLGGIEGRKTLIYVGDRLTLQPLSELLEGLGPLLELDEQEVARIASQHRTLDTYRDFEEMLRQANGQGVTFYTVTPLSFEFRGNAEIGSFGSASGGLSSALRSAQDAANAEGACLLSHSTGGLCQVGGSEPEILVERAVEDLDASYSLGYTQDRPSDGRFHEFRVKVKRPGLKVRHREGYLDKLPDERLRERLSAALLFDTESNDLAMELRLAAPEAQGSKRDRAKRYKVPVEVRVPIDRMALIPRPQGETRQAKARLWVATMRDDGRDARSQSFTVSFEVTEAQANASPPIAFTHTVDLELDRGSHRVAIGFWDEIGLTGSFLGRAIELGED